MRLTHVVQHPVGRPVSPLPAGWKITEYKGIQGVYIGFIEGVPVADVGAKMPDTLPHVVQKHGNVILLGKTALGFEPIRMGEMV